MVLLGAVCRLQRSDGAYSTAAALTTALPAWGCGGGEMLQAPYPKAVLRESWGCSTGHSQPSRGAAGGGLAEAFLLRGLRLVPFSREV